MAFREPTGDEDLLQSVQDLVSSLNNEPNPIRHGGVERDLSLTTGDQEVYHGLGRVPTVCMPLKKDAAGDVYVVTPHSDPRNYINVRGSAAFNARVLIA